MTQTKILTDRKAPFCQGCGHGIIVKSISKALIGVNYTEKDVVIVSDIGCSGLVDPLFNTHSIHGLHGRAPALGVGVSLGLDNPDKKVVVIIGDGGVTIGLQHVLEAARRNIDLTLVVMNNLLYGMTGGQISGLSTQKFKEQRHFDVDVPPFDIVKLAHASGAAFSARATSIKTYDEVLREAFTTKGFSIVELSSLCTSYAFKKLGDLMEVVEEADTYHNDRVPVRAASRKTISLLDELEPITTSFDAKINRRIGVVMAGSAGGGVQSAAKFLASSGMRSGFFATMKGEYPVTVGTGFSIAEVILSKDPVNYTGLENPEVFIIVSMDGWHKVQSRLPENTLLLVDSSLDIERSEGVIYGNFEKVAGRRGAALCALAYWMKDSKTMDLEALKQAVSNHKRAGILLKAIEAADNVEIESA